MTIDILKRIWPEWEIEEKPLGKGSFGVVYKAVRSDYNVNSYAAIKVISIPSDPSEVDSLRSEGLDIEASKTFLRGIVDDFVNEIRMMETLKGVPNIVSVEDYKVVEKTDGIGWDIYIRMELLTTFNVYSCDKKLTEEEVIKLGCDICTALEICEQRNIIHRDIKLENIFINDFGYFKLGDFGIARKLENLTGGLSQKGSPNYMAPEVAAGSDYDSRVDTYSLGIVLYRLLNGNRLPFLDTEKQLLNHNERENALNRRLRGEALPAPCDASPAMADVILRACAYDPDLRFSSATEMKQVLMSVANGTYHATVVEDLNGTISVRRASSVSNQQAGQVVNTATETVDPNGTISIFGAFSDTDQKPVKLVNPTTEAVDPNATISVRRASVASDQQAGQVVNTFGPTPDGDAIKRKKHKMIITIASAVSGACVVLVLEIVLLPKIIYKPAPDIADGDASSTALNSSSGSSPVSSAPSTVSAEPVEITVTILGVEYDIATTKELDLSNKGLTDSQLKQIAPQIEKLTNLTCLYLGANSIEDREIPAVVIPSQYNQISDITPLAKLTNLTELDLRSNQISDITPLAKLTNLTFLDLNENQISDITPLANLTNLISLNLRANQISDITPLAKLSNLRWLALTANRVSDITPLAKLSNLTDLILPFNQISDITPLAELTQLTDVSLEDNQVSDITTLANLTNLTSLNVGLNQISDITPIAKFTKLTWLNLTCNQISDITLLANFTNLTVLWLSDNQISDITPLANLTNLTLLDLRNNPIGDITPLSKLTNLENLYLDENITPQETSVTILGVEYDIATTTELVLVQSDSMGAPRLDDDAIKDLWKLKNLKKLKLGTQYIGTSITSLNGIENLQDLEELSISGGKIQDITPLANLTNLKNLTLEHNQKLFDITPLANLINLRDLSLGCNQISDITPLAKLTNLTSLSLNQNQISNITPLAKLTNLTEHLNLSHNQISDITPLAKLVNLTSLRLDQNQIGDITPLAKHTNLTSLMLFQNQISNITPLTNLTNLTYLSLYNNQISDNDIAKLREELPNCDVS